MVLNIGENEYRTQHFTIIYFIISINIINYYRLTLKRWNSRNSNYYNTLTIN